MIIRNSKLVAVGLLPFAILAFSTRLAGADSTIYYTTDGSNPTHNSPVYSAPITVSNSETINAVCSASGYTDSPVGFANYIISSNRGGVGNLTLNLPAFLPANANISVSYSGSGTPGSYQWTFTPQTNGAQYSLHGAPSPGNNSASFTTQSPIASLIQAHLALQTYLIQVQALDNNSNLMASAQGMVTLVPGDLSGINVYPNPWRSDRYTNKQITFDGLPVNTSVKIFTVSGHWVKSLPTSSGSTVWDLTTDSGDTVASGIYLYLITTADGQKQQGKLAVIR